LPELYRLDRRFRAALDLFTEGNGPAATGKRTVDPDKSLPLVANALHAAGVPSQHPRSTAGRPESAGGLRLFV